MLSSRPAFIAWLGLIALAAGCQDGRSSQRDRIVFVAEGELLLAYDIDDPTRRQAVIAGNEDESKPDIPAVNGNPCFHPSDPELFVIADDAVQPNPPPGWSLIRLRGDRVGALAAQRLARFHPSYQGGIDGADPYACAWLSDGRLLTVDIGNNASGAATGQLVIWFPPIGENPSYCKLDVAIGTAGGIHVDEGDDVYVASARVEPGVHRYRGPFPTDATAAGGCGRADSTGAPLATEVRRERFIETNARVAIANGVTRASNGRFYVSSVISGVIGEFDASGRFLRTILEPPSGEVLGTEPYSTGTPLGITADSDGSIYYADLGLVLSPSIGPGRGKGSLRRIRFEGDVPQPPELIESGLRFPDGVGVRER